MKDFFNKETLDNIKQFCAENKKTPLHGVAAHKTGFEKQILWQLPDKGC